jgi:hypothetical protein
MKYYTTDDDYKKVEIDNDLAKEVIRQYVERRYTAALLAATFIIGFLCGVIAYAL